MTIESKTTAYSLTIRYTTQPADPAMMGAGAIIAGSVVLVVLLNTSTHPGLFLTLMEIGLGGLILFGIAVLGSGKQQAPPTTVTTRFTRAQEVRVETRRGSEAPLVTELAFEDIADLRVFSSAGGGSSTDTMLIVPRQGAPIEIAGMSQLGMAARRVPSLARDLRAWTGLSGPEVSPLGKAVQWTSGWGHS